MSATEQNFKEQLNALLEQDPLFQCPISMEPYNEKIIGGDLSTISDDVPIITSKGDTISLGVLKKIAIHPMHDTPLTDQDKRTPNKLLQQIFACLLEALQELPKEPKPTLETLVKIASSKLNSILRDPISQTRLKENLVVFIGTDGQAFDPSTIDDPQYQWQIEMYLKRFGLTLKAVRADKEKYIVSNIVIKDLLNKMNAILLTAGSVEAVNPPEQAQLTAASNNLPIASNPYKEFLAAILKEIIETKDNAREQELATRVYSKMGIKVFSRDKQDENWHNFFLSSSAPNITSAVRISTDRTNALAIAISLADVEACQILLQYYDENTIKGENTLVWGYREYYTFMHLALDPNGQFDGDEYCINCSQLSDDEDEKERLRNNLSQIIELLAEKGAELNCSKISKAANNIYHNPPMAGGVGRGYGDLPFEILMPLRVTLVYKGANPSEKGTYFMLGKMALAEINSFVEQRKKATAASTLPSLSAPCVFWQPAEEPGGERTNVTQNMKNGF